ncbi:methyltransferase family protein [Porphyromonas circumdentaria]|uniref:Protein-S-isoprenylcysteine O-methyltransferase Ste14 n=1 Tax=Porphyromonas circumdentaria TaxID=29524 RepID=A0A1T4LWD7_9PORP|nr:isoprenylcysteine carboxylmethyltransferase family protein [Porphyromonas circumdentaria]MBB6275403.1 protein-S-isoprenylcysteine O-methyltransferase Ste14 [Porphyromonas circumdentaria]MDO4722100.1 isoprenylcysteine carboxylmethyltransferase family protein [Porphyromonas circumdentaria]SJZ58951.1 Protein-S-isoprenylcysteine O-methyltransferase Ste14 [Porphyromonas circumdentaria]
MKLKIPPVVVCALFAVLMWGVAWNFSLLHFRSLYVAGISILLGGGVALAGVVAFRKAQTTVHPQKFDGCKALVDSGIYALSRNPMYLGMAIILFGWAFWLGEMLALLGVVGFVLYMNYFQICPEEQMLKAKFGATFEKYCQKTRRWL